MDASGRTGQYKTINAAINAFQSGDVIRVVFGTYNESITLTGKSVNIQGIGGISSTLTWLAFDYKATRIPLGPIFMDLGKPIFSYLRSHDTQGRASIPMDLRHWPSSFIGVRYAIQTVSLSTANVLSLSAPRIGVIGL